ncbi:hypothetical protein SELMODRAFT_176312 [Selaginella moellendorffii]|uniref:Uncharacterized protein n=1 Tax=Selaginella moellendorffii TaxID=88036 RepID=D8S263_SELML|nr:uncharacterized protein LOC9656110 [Selaginella moellendorffii]EFJ21407.1 hypothetical protein SELMODRAFT_176312 [Selaginella moellendorffii]|eukprot:XP_002977403.1 uncharacterized protein LOC9656110 [Selaginella moellendorffii]
MWSARSIDAVLLLVAFSFSLSRAFVPPSSKCYALDGNYRLHDFTQWIGHQFEHSSNNGDFVLRFCKDVQLRSNKGYVNYGRFVPLLSTSENGNFVQHYNQGDLQGCENNGFDLSGRNSEVSVSCGRCDGTSCTDSFGCICNVTSTQSSCSSKIVAAVKCSEGGPRVIKGFTVGFSPRGREIVENGITQWGYDKFHSDYSFSTEQRAVSLYFTAPTALSRFVKKPSFTVKPSKGLTVQLAGSAAEGESPTTESPTVLSVDWQCDKPTGGPYVVTVSVPADGFNPVVFNLGKECEHKQKSQDGGSSGWATFGVICLVVILVLGCCCCGGFCYNTRVEHKHGFDALPGVTTLARYLDSASGQARSDGYRPAEDASSTAPSRPTRTSDSSKYGTV